MAVAVAVCSGSGDRGGRGRARLAGLRWCCVSRRRAWRWGGVAAAVWQDHSGERHRALSQRRDMAKPRRLYNFIISSTREITKLDLFVLLYF